EVLELGDSISVFRNGQNVSYQSISEVDIPWIVGKMTGKEIDQSTTYYPSSCDERVLLSVEGLSGKGFSNVSFKLHAGEILGFSGLVGAGRSEIMQTILGILPAYSGVVYLDGEKLKLGDSSISVSKGFAYLPEERKRQAILPTLSVRENIAITLLDMILGPFGVSRTKERDLILEIIEEFSVKTTGLETEIRYLSGGNQQKAIIGRAMHCSPKVLVFDEPTKGIDVGTKSEIYLLMKELADRADIGIILVSSEMEEVLKCSNRIITLYDGNITGDFKQGVPKETIMRAILENTTAHGAKK
ncbi:MAG: ATP-binding cassette domain-containing protein, partial [Spirochaetaceae bacterium]|nr:ATP-binding cassette domain-containing protein [Spirochaetaceae bacterium]